MPTLSLWKKKNCTCQVFQKLKIPCGHALLAADYIGLPYAQLFGDCNKTQSWIDTYAGVIYPKAPLGDHPVPDSITMLPPPPRLAAHMDAPKISVLHLQKRSK